MANNAFFLTERYLKANTPLSDNIDVKEIYPHAKTAEDIYIQEAIGSSLYERLIDSLSASPANTTNDEVTLLKKIRDALIWYTAYDALPFIWVKLRNVGLVKQSGENLETTSQSEMNHIRKELKNKADFYLKRVQDYLCCNAALFPEYKCTCSKCSINPVKKRNSSALAIERPECEAPRAASPATATSPFIKKINGQGPDADGNLTLNCEDFECEIPGFPIKSINEEGPDENGNIDLSAADVGADPAGSAATAITVANDYTDNASANAYANAVSVANAHSDANDAATLAASESYTDTVAAGKQNTLGFTAENSANKDTDVTLAANSDTKYPSQKAVKAYIDGRIAASDAVVYKGGIDCSTNPDYPAADAGHLYIASVAGKIGGASGITVTAGDLFLCKTDSTVSGTQAGVGANWDVIETNFTYVPENVANKDTDGTFAANSDVKYPSQKAAKTYIDAGLARKTIPVFFKSFIAINPAANTTYYFGAVIDTFGWTTSSGFRTFYPGITGTVVAASITYYATVAPTASTETSSLYLRVNNATDNLITSAINIGSAAFSTRIQALVTGLNIAVVDTDLVEIKWPTPVTMVQAPNNLYMEVILYVKP